MTTVAAVQMISSPDVLQNIASARRLVAEAAASGATLVTLPEYWPIMGLADTDKVGHAEQPGQGPIQDFMAEAAREHGIWLIGGTLPLVSNDAGKVMNATLVYDPQGKPVSRYDKIHLFGFTKGSESYDEARTIVPGESVVMFDAPFGRVGLAICYDLRFPELFRAMGECTLIVVTAAFTHTTGKAHWEVLLRARDRKPMLCAGLGPGRAAPERAAHVWPQHADRPLGRGQGGAGRGRGRGQRRHRSGLPGRGARKLACAQASQTVEGRGTMPVHT